MRRAFTLVELLVVVGVIVLLLTIMLPTFVLMEDLARRTACENNHHQLIGAVAQYSANANTYLTYPNWLAPETSHAWEGAGWLYYYDKLTNPLYNYVLADLRNGLLWPYLANHQTYRCPADVSPRANSSNAITSYLMNGSVAGYGRSPLRLYRALDFDPLAIAIWEAEDTLWNDGSSFPSEGLTRRHRDGATVGCFDGHADWISRDAFNLEIAKYPGRLWCNPGMPTGY